MTISLITGLPGFGKTLKLSEFAVKANAAGRPVYTNFRMQNMPNPSLYTHYNDPLEVLGRVKGNANGSALVLISEIGIVLPQHRMYEVDPSVWDELSQHRKDGVNIIADCQAWKQPAYLFKELIQFHYDIYGKYRALTWGKPDSEGFRKHLTFQLVRVRNPITGESYGRRYWKQHSKFFKFYDTKYKLEKTPTLYDIAQDVVKSPYSALLEQRYLEELKERREFRGALYGF